MFYKREKKKKNVFCELTLFKEYANRNIYAEARQRNTKAKKMILEMHLSGRALIQHTQGLGLDSRMERREELRDEKDIFWI